MGVRVYSLNGGDIYDYVSKSEHGLRHFDYDSGYWYQYVRSGDLVIEFSDDGWSWWDCDIPMYCNDGNGELELWV